MLDLFIVLSYFAVTLTVGLKDRKNTYTRRRFSFTSRHYITPARALTTWVIWVEAGNGMYYASERIFIMRPITKMSLLFGKFWIAFPLLGLGAEIGWRIIESGFGSKLTRSQTSPSFHFSYGYSNKL